MNKKIILLGLLFLLGCGQEPVAVLHDEPASEGENISDDPMFDPMPQGVDPETGGPYVPIVWNTPSDENLPCVDGSGGCTNPINWPNFTPDPNGTTVALFPQNNGAGSIPSPRLTPNNDPGTQDLSKIFDRYGPNWLLEGVFGTQNGPQIPQSLPPSVVDIEAPALPAIVMPTAPSVGADPAAGLSSLGGLFTQAVNASKQTATDSRNAMADLQTTLKTKNAELGQQVSDEIEKKAIADSNAFRKQLDDLKKKRDATGTSSLQKIPSIDKPVPRPNYNTSPESVEGIAVRRAQSYVDFGRRTVESSPETNEGKAVAKQLLENSQEVVNSADFNYAKGNSASGDAGLRLAYSLVDAAINLAPIVAISFGPPGLIVAIGLEAVILTKNWYEYKTGKSIWTGQSLSPFQRDMALVNVGLAFVPAGTAIVSSVLSFKNSLKVTKDVVSHGKSAGEIATINNTIKRAENIAVEGEAQGYKSVADSFDHVWTDNLGNIKWPPNRGFDGPSMRDRLTKGTLLDRYGEPHGTFVSPAGTPFEQRALPPSAASKPLHTYEVLEPIGVDAGRASPWFGEPGGGIQYELDFTVQDLINWGILREVN
ncbi:MAG TPA: TNT domain-containing protein [Oligoflexus sp.]|uniref:TNT domain-containing protein n=1 Tax=Oligoflexus sp. TaxID=1971216 RepID=UPI002D3B7E5D|nr:TNT domain-containing protein [Oligoflexus sp.]HYX31605.1 TNT domain-containing protein [Oligoflexus sp.]